MNHWSSKKMDHSADWRLLTRRTATRLQINAWLILLSFATVSLALPGCHPTSNESGVYPVTYHPSSLPNVTLIDQYGQRVALAALKGKPALFDFIYTSCPGPCQLLTQHMKLIANKLGPDLGQKVTFVSVTVDPDHDRPSRLLDYGRAFNANVKGWYFLTGSPAQIDKLLRGFQLGRTRDSDGEIDHVLGFFLVGPEGHEIADYSQSVDPSKPARDALEAANRNTAIGRLSANLRRL
jgi:protein SCO1